MTLSPSLKCTFNKMILTLSIEIYKNLIDKSIRPQIVILNKEIIH